MWSCWFFSPLRRADYDSHSAEIEYAAAQVGLAQLNQALEGLDYRLEERT